MGPTGGGASLHLAPMLMPLPALFCLATLASSSAFSARNRGDAGWMGGAGTGRPLGVVPLIPKVHRPLLLGLRPLNEETVVS